MSSYSKKHLQRVKKIDQTTIEILGFASYVVIYKLKDYQWERENIEGVLFLTRRAGQPSRRIIVANRIGLNNLIEDIGSDFEFELNEDYIFFRSQGNVRGLWFGKGDEKLSIYDALKHKQTTRKATVPTVVPDKGKKLHLSKTELKQTLLELLDDDDFVETLHNKYLNRVKS